MKENSPLPVAALHRDDHDRMARAFLLTDPAERLTYKTTWKEYTSQSVRLDAFLRRLPLRRHLRLRHAQGLALSHREGIRRVNFPIFEMKKPRKNRMNENIDEKCFY